MKKSLSVIIPTSFSFSITGTEPIFDNLGISPEEVQKGIDDGASGAWPALEIDEPTP